MKKLTDYNFKLLSLGKRVLLNDCITFAHDDLYGNHLLGRVVLIDFFYNSKVVEVHNVFELFDLYCDFLKADYVDILPLSTSLKIQRLLDIFSDLGVSVIE